MKNYTSNFARLAFVFCFCTQVSSQVLAGIFFPSGNNILYFNSSQTQSAISVFHQLPTATQVTALKVDPLGSLTNGTPKLYFAATSTTTSTIYSCNISACASTMVVIYIHASALPIYGLELDFIGKNVFWIADSDIWRGKSDGTLVLKILANLNDPRKLAISDSGTIYVTLASKNGKKAGDGIGRFNTTGGNYSRILSGTVVNPSGICVDSETSTLYIIDLDKDSIPTKKIVTSDVNGGSFSTLINTLLVSPQSIQFFKSSTKEIYWVDQTSQTLSKYDLLQGGRTNLAVFNYTQATDLALHVVYIAQQTMSSASPTPSITPTPSSSASPSTTPSNTPSSSATASRTPSPSVSPSISSTPTTSPWTTQSISPSISSTPSNTPSSSPTPSVTPSSTPSNTPSSSAIPSVTPTSTPSSSSSVTPSPSFALTEITSCSGGDACENTFADDSPSQIVKKYDRNQLLAIVLIPALLSLFGTAAFISFCVVLLKRQRRTNHLQDGVGIEFPNQPSNVVQHL